MKTLSIKNTFEEIIRQNQEAVTKSFAPSQLEVLEKIADLIARALRSGRKILLCGNGGSAADSQHIAAEFIGRFKRERQSLPAIALTTDTSILTAIGNDYAFEKIFARQVEGLGQKGDVLIALSTGGNSKNVLEAVKAAKARGVTTVGFTGVKGGALKDLVDHCFYAQSSETSHIQEVHITALHALSEVIEDLVFSEN
ncbi:MAG: D-sedoheptulose 7-phosphate isomerase [Candidatus Omnitrophica bacterium]|nr:D-sedoheptulose 7-phosphate isomerase [Candidatus Omnitrophota bacterium]